MPLRASAAKPALERTGGGSRKSVAANDTSVKQTQVQSDPRKPSPRLGEDDDGRAAGLQLEPCSVIEHRGRYASNN